MGNVISSTRIDRNAKTEFVFRRKNNNKIQKKNKQEGQDTHTQSVGLIFSGMSEERWEQGKEKERDMRFSFRVF
jgi:hypothetical protein